MAVSKKISKPLKKVKGNSVENSASDAEVSDGYDDEEISEPESDPESEQFGEESEEEPEEEEDDEEKLEDDATDAEKAKPNAKKRSLKPTKEKNAKRPRTVKGNWEEGGKNTREVLVGEEVSAPDVNAKTHIILPWTMEFLSKLSKNNNRDWFHTHDALYRHALLNWQSFIEHIIPIVSRVDWTVPALPVKDVIHRIYRDVRFSNDKTPYKRNLGVSFSRTGRKGPFALYYLHIQPGNNSLFAAGKWQPEKDQLADFRSKVLADAGSLRAILKDENFVKYFGEPTPGKRTSIYGHDDELKNSPKMEGVTKKHPDIDLLKIRSPAVETRFTDDQVLAADFAETLEKVLLSVRPFIAWINGDDDEDNED